MLTVVDYNLGNLGSISNMLRKLGHPARITADPREIASASRLILPGVGAFDRGMANLRSLGLIEALHERVVHQRVPILGICLGAQLMTQGSDEGESEGLGWIEGKTIRFFSGRSEAALKVPSMGWNDVHVQKQHMLFDGMYPEPRFYFVHSYHFLLADPADVLATSQYGYEFASAFARDNVLGVQFHPEKSHKFGMKLLDNFAAGGRDADALDAAAEPALSAGG